MPKRKIIVNIATSADGYVARTDGNLDWLTRRPAPKGFYGLPKFSRSIDAKILGRKTFDVSVKMGASFSAEQTVSVQGQTLPGPIQRSVIKMQKDNTLSFDGKPFRREAALNASASQ